MESLAARDMVDLAKHGRTEGLIDREAVLGPNLQGQEVKTRQEVLGGGPTVAMPPLAKTYGSIEGLMNHFMLVMDNQGIQPPPGEAYAAVEGANGELGFYVVSDGHGKPYRVRVHPPCFPIMAALPGVLEGEMLADLVATFGSVNMIGGELDR